MGTVLQFKQKETINKLNTEQAYLQNAYSDEYGGTHGGTPCLKLQQPNSATEFLQMVRGILDPMDYEELLCCILDHDYYQNSDEEIQLMVTEYYDILKGESA